MHPFTLITPRLVLRDFCDDDLEDFQAFYCDPVVQLYEKPAPSLEEARQTLESMVGFLKFAPPSAFRSRYNLAVVRDKEVIGELSLYLNNSRISEFEIGWTIRLADWGKGYATEAGRALLRFAFEKLKAHRVVAFCHYQNAASARVMEKLGMQLEGLLRETRRLNDQWADELVYGILEREFI